jgi:hypothetical protein
MLPNDLRRNFELMKNLDRDCSEMVKDFTDSGVIFHLALVRIHLINMLLFGIL